MENKFEFDNEPEEDEIVKKYGDVIEESAARAEDRDKRKQPPMPMHGAGLRGTKPRPLSGKIRKRIKEIQE